MLHINEIDLYYEPRNNILSKLTDLYNEPEMSEDESAFLCGIIKKYRPKKILEVGIAGGGSSAIILSCLNSLGMLNSILYSVDYSDRFYLNEQYESGYLGKQARDILKFPRHNYCIFTGDIACNFKEIGDNIDLLIIDTMHTLPGELLDFITLLPSLNNNAIVVLHDTALAYMLDTHKSSIATNVLLASTVGAKYINTFDFFNRYANIAAIKIDKFTREYVSNVFLSLLVPWNYMPDATQLAGYRKVIKEVYTQKLVDLFDIAIALNGRYLNSNSQTGWLFPFGRVEPNSNVVLFGAGDVGRAFEHQVKHTNYCNIVGILDNDDTKWDEKVSTPQRILKIQYDYVVVAIADRRIADKIIRQLLDIGVTENSIIWDSYTIG